MLIAILRYRREKLFIEIRNPKKSKDFIISCFHREKNKRIKIGRLEYMLKVSRANAIPTEIYIDDMDIEKKFQCKGYGKILMNFCKGIAQASNLPIRLYSLEEVIGFYKKCGFKSESLDSQDMIWTPNRILRSDKCGKDRTKKRK